MPQTDYSEFETKNPGDRTMMQVLYGMHTVAPFTLWSLATLALILNYIRRSDEGDALYVMHHNYMIATFWWTLLWLVLTFPLWVVTAITFGWVPLGPLAVFLIGVWYLYRCIRGWLRFNDGRAPT
jgi:uncharacterized membrane protein